LTTENFIFGGFTTANWESEIYTYSYDKAAFLFSVNEGRKYPITSADRIAIYNYYPFCAAFGIGC
jgi:hypothetical protein